MDSTDPPRSTSFDSVRDAFDQLGTSEKAAFVFEATFNTLGQALGETGRRVSSAIDDLDIDAWFRPPPRGPRPAPPPPRPAKKAPTKKRAKKGPSSPEGPLGTPPKPDDMPPPSAT